MGKPLISPDSSPADATLHLADYLANRFSPQRIGDEIETLLTAMRPAKKGEERVINERARESGLKMLALYRQLADNERRNGSALPPPQETEEEVMERLLASPAALRSALIRVARDAKGRRIMEEVLTEEARVLDVEITSGEG